MSLFSKKSEVPKEESVSEEFVPKADFERFMNDFSSFKDNVTEFFMKQQQPQVQRPAMSAPAPVQIDDVPEEEYRRAVREGGEGAEAIIAKRVQATIQRAQQPILQELHAIKSQGLSSIAHLTRAALSSKPHYARFRKDIDSALDALDPALQTNPQVLESVYSMVVGQNADLIAEERVNEAIRKASEPPAEEPGGGRRRMKSSKGEEMPTPEDVWGEDGLRALEMRYGSRGDAAVSRFLATQGCKSWEQYVEEVVKPFGGR